MGYQCPHCQSDNIQKLAVVYEGGLSHIDTHTKGSAVGFGRGGIGVGVGAAKTQGTSQTAASKRATPPGKKDYFRPLLGFFGLYLLGSLFFSKNAVISFMLPIVCGGLAIWWEYYAYQYNSKTWPQLKDIWDHSFLCNRCNEIFQMN